MRSECEEIFVKALERSFLKNVIDATSTVQLANADDWFQVCGLFHNSALILTPTRQIILLHPTKKNKRYVIYHFPGVGGRAKTKLDHFTELCVSASSADGSVDLKEVRFWTVLQVERTEPKNLSLMSALKRAMVSRNSTRRARRV